jgi:hypothetical protein
MVFCSLIFWEGDLGIPVDILPVMPVLIGARARSALPAALRLTTTRQPSVRRSSDGSRRGESLVGVAIFRY